MPSQLQHFVVLAYLTGLVGACPNGFISFYGQKCIHLYDFLQTREEAIKKCREDGGSLVSVHSKQEATTVFDYARAVSSAEQAAWIGLDCDPETNVFWWTDESPLEYLARGTYECTTPFVLRLDTGQWEPSTQQKNYAICMIEEDNDDPCHDGYLHEEELSLCIKASDEDASWTVAEANCAEDGAHLVSIHSQESNTYFRRLALSNKYLNGFHIGFQLVNGAQSWSDGSNVDYTNFDSGMPESLFGDCVSMTIRSLSAPWISIHCDQLSSLPYFCIKSAKPILTTCPEDIIFTGSGEIGSPEHSGSISTRMECTYMIAADVGKHLMIEFTQLMLLDGDSVALYEGFSSEPLAVITRLSYTAGDIFSTKNDNVMRLKYTIGLEIGERKWHAQFITIF